MCEITYNIVMKFKNIKVKNLIVSVLVSFVYPITKSIISNNRLLVFSDTCLIIGLISLVIGLMNSLYLHGDFDITNYIAHTLVTREGNNLASFLTRKNNLLGTATKSEREDLVLFVENQKNKRKDSFNYPLFCSILLLIMSYITSLLV